MLGTKLEPRVRPESFARVPGPLRWRFRGRWPTSGCSICLRRHRVRGSPWTDRIDAGLWVRTCSSDSPSSQFHSAASILEFGALGPGIDLLRCVLRRGGWTAAVSCGRREDDELSPSDVSWTVAIRTDDTRSLESSGSFIWSRMDVNDAHLF